MLRAQTVLNKLHSLLHFVSATRLLEIRQFVTCVHIAIMAPPAYAIDNMQDVGGLGFVPGADKYALTTDTVDAPLSVAIEKSGKPVKYWE